MFYKIHGETPMSESLFNKAVGWRQLCYKVDYKYFPVNLREILKNTFFTKRLPATASERFAGDPVSVNYC